MKFKVRTKWIGYTEIVVESESELDAINFAMKHGTRDISLDKIRAVESSAERIVEPSLECQTPP